MVYNITKLCSNWKVSLKCKSSKLYAMIHFCFIFHWATRGCCSSFRFKNYVSKQSSYTKPIALLLHTAQNIFFTLVWKSELCFIPLKSTRRLRLWLWIFSLLMIILTAFLNRHRPNSFVMITANRVLHCNADTPEEMHHWITLLQRSKGDTRVDGQEFIIRGDHAIT